MRTSLKRLLRLAVWLCATTAFSQSDIWVTAYYPAYYSSVCSPDDIDYLAATHLIHFSLVPDSSTGYFDEVVNGISATRRIDTLAHKYNRMILIAVGGANSRNSFNTIMNNTTLRTRFIDSLTSYVSKYSYDGIDLDWEMLEHADSANFSLLVSSLRGKLGTKLLTMALTSRSAYNYPGDIAAFQGYLDQINLMNYDLADTGYHKTWSNSSLLDQNAKWASDTNKVLPSANGMVTSLCNAGVANSKIGVGIDFNGWYWAGGRIKGDTLNGVTKPRQILDNTKVLPTFRSDVSYREIMDTKWTTARYKWDDSTQTPYLSIENPTASADSFISYDNQQSCVAKVNYVRALNISSAQKLGGIMIWDLTGGWRPSLTGSGVFKDSLLQCIKDQAFGKIVYKYNLQRPWQDASTGTVDYNNTTRAKIGTQCIKFSKFFGGAQLGLQYGPSANLDPSQYNKLEFYIYTDVPSSGFTAQLYSGTTRYGYVTLGNLFPGWVLISIPMSTLDPSNHTFNKLIIKDSSASNLNYWVDNIRFFRTDTVTSVMPGTSSMVSIPMIVKNYRDTIVYPNYLDSVIYWDAKTQVYKKVGPRGTNLQNGLGYWVKFSNTPTINYIGTSFLKTTDSTYCHWNGTGWDQTWNLLGGVTSSVPTAKVVSSVTGNVLSSFFKYRSGYIVVNSIDPGDGIWVKVGQPGTLTFESSVNWPKTRPAQTDPTDGLGRFTVTDVSGGRQDMFIKNITGLTHFGPVRSVLDDTLAGEELPPDPPPGFFSVHFSTRNYVQPIVPLVGIDKTLSIQLKSLTYPAEVAWELPSTIGIAAWMDNGGGKVNVGAKGKVTLSSAPRNNEVILHYSAAQAALPVHYALEQNYPNPFNPETKIRFAIPEVGRVRLTVYDILGREVQTLLDEAQGEAGYRTVRFDAGRFASGVYFYRLEAGKFTQVKKMLLMR